MSIDIQQLSELERKATPGPWEVDYLDKAWQRVVRAEHYEIFTGWHHSVGSIEVEMEANAALIVAMRNALPALLDAAELTSRAREDALREAGAEAKTAWLHYPRGEIGDADHDSALCEYVAERIALIDKPKDAPAPLPAAPVDGGENA